MDSGRTTRRQDCDRKQIGAQMKMDKEGNVTRYKALGNTVSC